MTTDERLTAIRGFAETMKYVEAEHVLDTAQGDTKLGSKLRAACIAATLRITADQILALLDAPTKIVADQLVAGIGKETDAYVRASVKDVGLT